MASSRALCSTALDKASAHMSSPRTQCRQSGLRNDPGSRLTVSGSAPSMPAHSGRALRNLEIKMDRMPKAYRFYILQAE